ncbi:MAG TPA: flagellar basal body P-ring protein FlgI [Steroidobacteraceae bacterium]|jgi:flagellar P-ring protein precursor FlgI
MRRLSSCLLVMTALVLARGVCADVRIKDLARIEGAHDGAILGYGLVVGLPGTGDSARNLATQQSVSNLLREFGLQIAPGDVSSRNVAAVLVTARLPNALRVGDKLDVNVSSIGDARSLAGGTLLITSLIGPDRTAYATAQGPIAVGGYRFEQNGNVEQKNFPTSGSIPEGAVSERELTHRLRNADGSLDLILNDPDYTTAARVAQAINDKISGTSATALESGRVRLAIGGASEASLVGLIASIENLGVEPDIRARVVVNERTGTIVSGGRVWLSAVTVTQGDIKVSITQDYLVSQPNGVYLGRVGSGINTAVVPETRVKVQEPQTQAVDLAQGATIADLVNALRAVKATSRDVIAVLQGIKRAGALHAELIIQ